MSTGRSEAVHGPRTTGARPPWSATAQRPGFGDDFGIEPELRCSRWADLDPATADGLLLLRASAIDSAAAGGADLVVDLDPAAEPVDLDDGTEHLWIPDDSGPVAHLRLRPSQRTGPDGRAAVLDRLCVRADVRQIDLGGALLADVVSRHGGTTLVADVPAEATGTFTRFGFAAVGTVLDTTPPVRTLTRLRRAPDTPWRED
jgi:predicted GNAT family N-acyltransferase